MKYKNKSIQISCDGGAATGKTTGAKMIAKKYGLSFLSSGLLYRYSSYLILKHAPKNKILFLKKRIKSLNYDKLHKINLHTPKISFHSAEIAKILAIRNILKKYQIKFIKKNRGCVLEGRDAGTKILPQSDVKFFFKCNLETAAKRRFIELKKRGIKINFKNVKKALKLRNISDKKRKHSPLKKAKNAVLVDTSKIGKKAMLTKMSKHIDQKLKKKYGN